LLRRSNKLNVKARYAYSLKAVTSAEGENVGGRQRTTLFMTKEQKQEKGKKS